METGGANGEYRIAEPTLHPFALSDNPALAKPHKTMIEVTPWLHGGVVEAVLRRAGLLRDLPQPAAPASLSGVAAPGFADEAGQLLRRHQIAHDGGLPGRCVDCHMPKVPSGEQAAKDGLIKSHRFAGSNTALPSFNRDLDQRRAVQPFLASGIVALRVAGVRTNPGEPFRPGDVLEIALEVRNLRAGRQFPAGTVDSNEARVQAAATDARGRAVASLGGPDGRGLLPEGAVRFGTRFVDAQGNHADRRNTTTEAVSVAENTAIPIRAARTV